MRVFTSITGLRCYLNLQRFSRYQLENGSIQQTLPNALPPDIGFVPTMGALHRGHLSLMQRARRENKLVVVSIFVNPLQFGPTEDFQRYPRTLEADKALCEESGVDVLFIPSPQEMGVNITDLTQVVPPARMIAGLCGRSRIGHFQGVATIVTKLLNIVLPTRAYFGQKDAQQVALIRRLVADLNIPVEIVPCPTLREVDGLALSSRNQYLSVEERAQASTLYRGLKRAEIAFQAGERSSHALIRAVELELGTIPEIAPEYIELVDPMTMETLNEVNDTGLLAVAARLGSTRLIDNLLLSNRKPIVAIDGPAGAGKSTVARMVAQTLDLLYLDTGAMYRALTWSVLRSGVSMNDEPAIAELMSRSKIEFQYSKPSDSEDLTTRLTPAIFVNDQDVTQEVRSLEVTSKVSTLAAYPTVRHELVRQQQAYGRRGGIVAEGRDIGTHVFPDAELKVFLTASVQERARRRQKDLQDRGIGDINLHDLEQSIYERDLKDSTRTLAPLCKAADAIELNTDELSIQEVVNRVVELYHAVLSR